MNLLELITHLRTSILDDIGGTGVDWTSIGESDDEAAQLRWSNEELTRFINEAQRQACRSSLLLKKPFSVSVISGTSEYTLDPEIINISRAYLASTGKPLTEAEYEEVMGIPFWYNETGTPEYYIVDIESSKITLYKKPDANDTLSLLAYHLPITDMSWDLAEIASPEIRVEYHLPMLAYAAYLAFSKDEANAFDPQRADYYRQVFEREFNVTSAYSETRKRRTKNRPIRYGGL